MKRNMIIATAIGALATYLPFWRWENMIQQIVGALAVGAIAFITLVATEREGNR